ncbi:MULTISPECIES: hypothetical protein [Marinomonas]|uniref:Uncharacterized protein n=1 Tax=Marinomonas rhodophyticola TaxID=2992803 RepID=A0ABT3KCH0_9GAMM|nr:hypothetical protein [Marinomonas sp. KJ51-3]MCW4627812.1 hypothetical protein [Marinomonas sp. KJ51-3]
MNGFVVVVYFIDDGDVTDLNAVVDVLVTDFFFVAADVVNGFWNDAGGGLAFDRGCCWCGGLG